MVGVSASDNHLPLHHKVQKFWHQLTQVVLKKGRKTVVVHYSLLLHQQLAVQKYIGGSFSSPLLWLGV